MKVKLVSRAGTDTRIAFSFQDDPKKAAKDFGAEKDALAVRYSGKTTTIYCGCGKKADCSEHVIRAAAARGVKKAADLKRKRVSIIAPKADKAAQSFAPACCEGAVLGSYVFGKYKSEKPKPVTSAEIVARDIDSKSIADIATVCACTCYARDLINDNASVTYPAQLANEAQAIASAKSIALEILDEKAIQQKGLGLLWAVGQGSVFPPRLILMSYTGNPSSKKKTAIVGKGITFDSGGQNLKTSGHIETMRCDMSGAAAVLGLMKAASMVKPHINLIGAIPAAHNAVGPKAYFPGDVYRSYRGTTVEITNTDAEGRLVLADAFSYVQKHYRPTEIIDFATLTGSILYALGATLAGLFSNNDNLAENLFAAGEKTGERLWRLPVYEEHGEAMKSDLADLRNTSKLKKGHAGSITGAAFLKEFVKNIPWAHIDIAGTAFNEQDARGEVPKYGTGFGVRLLWEYLKKRQPNAE